MAGLIVEAIEVSDDGHYLPASLRAEGEKMVTDARAALAASAGEAG